MSSEEYAVEFTFVDENGAETRHLLHTGEYTLGRADDCDICFPSGASGISRKHARLTVAPDGVTIEDLDSRTGTMVNGRVVHRQELNTDDSLMIGSYSVRVRIPDAGKARKSALVVAPGETPTPGQDADRLEADLARLAGASQRLMAEVGKRIVGQEQVLRAVWAAILSREHCLMIGVPGLAKTLMVTTFAEALGLATSRIQFTPDLMPSDIIGSSVIQETEEGKRRFEFVQGPIFTQLLLADEINRTPPKTQSALLEAMQERQVTVGNRSLALPSPFCVIATQNPIEQEGTYPLPEAQQDRFMLCVTLDYPTRDQEIDVLVRTAQGSHAAVSRVVDHQEILAYQKVLERIAIGRELVAYVADLVRATRPGREQAPKWVSEMIDWGAGPRAGQSVIRGAKAVAAMEGRPAVSRDDIREMLLPALRHRISCNYRARSQGMNEDRLVGKLLDEIPVP